MPQYNPWTSTVGLQVAPGDLITLFSPADVLAAGNVSNVIFPVDSGPVARSAITFQTQFASTPTAVVEIFGSNTPPTQGAGGAPQNGVLLYTSTNKQSDSYTDNLAFNCYWMQLVSQSAGGTLTATASVR